MQGPTQLLTMPSKVAPHATVQGDEKLPQSPPPTGCDVVVATPAELVSVILHVSDAGPGAGMG